MLAVTTENSHQDGQAGGREGALGMARVLKFQSLLEGHTFHKASPSNPSQTLPQLGTKYLNRLVKAIHTTSQLPLHFPENLH